MYSYIYYSGGQRHCCSYRSVSFSINNCVFDEYAAQLFGFVFHSTLGFGKTISFSLSPKLRFLPLKS